MGNRPISLLSTAGKQRGRCEIFFFFISCPFFLILKYNLSSIILKKLIKIYYFNKKLYLFFSLSIPFFFWPISLSILIKDKERISALVSISCEYMSKAIIKYGVPSPNYSTSRTVQLQLQHDTPNNNGNVSFSHLII